MAATATAEEELWEEMREKRKRGGSASLYTRGLAAHSDITECRGDRLATKG